MSNDSLDKVFEQIVRHRCMGMPYAGIREYYEQNREVLTLVDYGSDEDCICGIVGSYVLAQLSQFVQDVPDDGELKAFIETVHSTIASHRSAMLALMQTAHAELTACIVRDARALRVLH